MTSDWRRALDVYVTGRNRSLTTEEKQQAARAGMPEAANTASSRATTSGTTTSGTSTFGVPIPQILDYYRNAGTWRDRIEASRKREADPGA